MLTLGSTKHRFRKLGMVASRLGIPSTHGGEAGGLSKFERGLTTWATDKASSEKGGGGVVKKKRVVAYT